MVFNLSNEITQENYLKRSETEVEFEIRLIASAIKFDIDNITILDDFLILLELSIVSVTINFLILELFICLTAFPLKTP